MNRELPLVSIVIANRNHEDTVLEAITSVTSQDYPHKQVVVVDDDSTDQSWERICAHIGMGGAPRDGAKIGMVDGVPVTAISLVQNVGRGGARNIGIQAAWERTHIFGNLDSDDVYLPGKISKSVAKILEDPETIGAVYTDFVAENRIGGYSIQEYKQSFDHITLHQNCIVNNDSLMTKLALETVGLYDDTMEVAEDWDLWLKIASRFLIVHIPESLVTVRITDKGASTSVHGEIWQKNWMKIRGKIQRGEY